MPVCTLCESSQPAGDACDVCGRPFAPGEAAPVPVPPAEGLEATRFEAVSLEVTPIPELEPTAYEPGDPLALAEVTPDLEPTAAAPVDTDAALIPDLERTDGGVPVDEATPFPVQVTCRYCRTPAGPGERLCGRCGMRLPVAVAVVAQEAASGRICGCGTVVRGGLCPACGARMS